MTTPGNPFEQRLLRELKSLAEATPGPTISTSRGSKLSVRRRLAIGGAVAGVSALIAAGTLTGGATPAYAVEKEGNGNVVVTVTSFQDPQGLERDLLSLGIHADVTYLPPGKYCEEPRFAPLTDPLPPQFGGVASDTSLERNTRFVILGGQLPSDVTLVLEGGSPESGFRMIRPILTRGPVAPCVLTDNPPSTWKTGHLPRRDWPTPAPTDAPSDAPDPEQSHGAPTG